VSDAPDPLGKRALFWAPAERTEERPPRGSDVAVTGKRALYSAYGPVAAEVPERGKVPTAPGAPAGLVPPVSLNCSSCGVQSDVDVVGFLALHVPFFLWRPGRGFTRFMTCPSCHRRTWISASWTPWSSR